MEAREKIAQAALRFANEVQAITVEQMRLAFAEVSGEARTTTRAAKNGNGEPVNGFGPKTMRVVKTLKLGKGGRARRTPEQLEEMGVKVLAFVTSKPGARMEEISSAVGSSTHELVRPVQLLLEQGKLRRSGTTRATVYNVGRKG